MEQNRLGVFSKERWGIGSTLIIASLLGLGLIILDRSLPRGRLQLALIGAVLLTGGVLLFAVRAAEEIHIDRRVRGNPLGATGLVVTRVEPVPGGVVKVGGELWSAESAYPIETGERVRVVGLDGLHARVEKVEDAS